MYIRDEKGVALLTLVIALGIFGTLAVSVTMMVSQGVVSGAVSLEECRARYLAEAGLNDSYWELKHGEKLYGGHPQPDGKIDEQVIVYADGATGRYRVDQPAAEIVSRGEVNGVEKTVTVKYTQGYTHYSLFSGNSGDVTFLMRASVTGNVYINGDVLVSWPSGIDTAEMDLYLPEGNSANYLFGTLFPYTTLNQAPSSPSVSTGWYDSLLNLAAGESAGDQYWNSDREISGAVYINGSVTTKHHCDITRGAQPGIIVTTGQFTLGHHATVSDSIIIISTGTINILRNSRVGTSEGTSGNAVFSGSRVNIWSNSEVTGVVMALDDVLLARHTLVKGLVFAVDEGGSILGRERIEGAMWVGGLVGSILNFRTEIDSRPEYIPSTLPRGLSPPGGGSEVMLVSGTWRED